MGRREGLALTTVLILSVIALAFTGIMLYMLTSSTQMAGTQYRYRSSIEVAKGVSQYLMSLMDEDELCNYTDCTKTDQPIDLGKYAVIGNYKVEARLLKYIKDPQTGASVYAVELKVVNAKVPAEHSTVDFVYKVE